MKFSFAFNQPSKLTHMNKRSFSRWFRADNTQARNTETSKVRKSEFKGEIEHIFGSSK